MYHSLPNLAYTFAIVSGMWALAALKELSDPGFLVSLASKVAKEPVQMAVLFAIVAMGSIYVGNRLERKAEEWGD